MILAAADPVDVGGSSGDLLTQVLAVVAVVVSLLAAILPAANGRQQRLRDDRAKRTEMYLELTQLVERHGLWVVDQTYDLVETSHEDFQTTMPHRRTGKPARTQRVRARAIVSAYGSSKLSEMYGQWQQALEDFEQKLDDFSFTDQEEGKHAVDPNEAKPLRDAEISARLKLADIINAELVRKGHRRRGTQGSAA